MCSFCYFSWRVTVQDHRKYCHCVDANAVRANNVNVNCLLFQCTYAMRQHVHSKVATADIRKCAASYRESPSPPVQLEILLFTFHRYHQRSTFVFFSISLRFLARNMYNALLTKSTLVLEMDNEFPFLLLNSSSSLV